ncbi:hypothetical protein AZE42_09801 [Rhizopogon vesiculosus]|uniref:Uncharacterized protein n=1 Tax=Rhizopogon vesiculosus TaxID=180088 RepID=A0A1J8Q316_9AGAM|nr:hypothetical protein AZE42_09801 [Rhizopogon vesiculosus]
MFNDEPRSPALSASSSTEGNDENLDDIINLPPSSTLLTVPLVPVSVPMTLIRTKRMMIRMPTYSDPPPPVVRRPPRMSVPSDIGEPDLFDEDPLPLVE